MLLNALACGPRDGAEGGVGRTADPEKLAALARHHRVVPVLFAKLREAGWKEEHLAPLRAESRRNAARMLALGAEWARLHRRFAAEGIRCLTLKGPALALLLYGDVTMRTCKDLDLLVAKRDFPRLQAVLREEGYVRMKGEDEAWAVERADEDEHHVEFVHPLRRMQVEAHWRINRGLEREPDFDELWMRGTPVEFGGAKGKMLGKEDLLPYLLVHGAEHGWFRLRWLLDIARLTADDRSAGGTSPEEAARRIAEYGCQNAAGQAAVLLSALFAIPAPPELAPYARLRRARALARAALPLIGADRPAPELPAFIAYCLLLMPGGRRLRYVFFPNERDRGMIRLPRPLHALYFALRPLLWCLRAARRFVFGRLSHGAFGPDEGNEPSRLLG